MITYRSPDRTETDAFWALLNTLDNETDFMMHEPGERARRTNPQELAEDLEQNVFSGGDFLEGAWEDGRMVGYLRAERGRFDRVAHTAYIVVGILASHRGQGIGTALLEHVTGWARTSGVRRLELTVECRNGAARHLYEKSGFVIEGLWTGSMLVGGTLVDEYYMAKLL